MKIISAKLNKKICWQITIATLMQPLQYDLRCPAAKVTHTDDPRMIPVYGIQPRVFRTRRTAKLPHPSSQTRFVLQNTPFVHPPTFKKSHFVGNFSQNLKRIWKRSFGARPPWKSDSWRCENEALVRVLPQNLKVEDVKTKLWCETSLKICKLKMCKRSFGARHPSKSEPWRCENKALVLEFPQNLKVKMWKWSFGARDLPQYLKVEDVKTMLWCETSLQNLEAEGVKTKLWCETSLQNLKVEDVKTKLWCECSLKIWQVKMWKQSFGARHPSKALVREFPQNLNLEDVLTKLWCETSIKNEALESSWQNDVGRGSYSAGPVQGWSQYSRACSATVALQTFPTIFRDRCSPAIHSFRASANFEKRISLKTSLQKWQRIKDVKTKLCCASSWKICKLEDAQQFTNEALVRDLPENLTVEDVKTKLWCKSSLKIWKLKMWKQSFGARLRSKSDSWRCMGLLCCEISLLQDFLAMRLLCCGDLFAVRSLCCEISLLWDLFAVRLLCCGTSWRLKIRNTEVRLQISFDK